VILEYHSPALQTHTHTQGCLPPFLLPHIWFFSLTPVIRRRHLFISPTGHGDTTTRWHFDFSVTHTPAQRRSSHVVSSQLSPTWMK
jgi:hypothetical protein